MADKPALWIIGTNVLGNDRVEDEFNRWYDVEHLPLLLSQLPGIKNVTRYRAVDQREGQPRYLAIYQLDSAAIYSSIMASPTIRSERQEWKKQWGGIASITLSWLYEKI